MVGWVGKDDRGMMRVWAWKAWVGVQSGVKDGAAGRPMFIFLTAQQRAVRVSCHGEQRDQWYGTSVPAGVVAGTWLTDRDVTMCCMSCWRTCSSLVWTISQLASASRRLSHSEYKLVLRVNSNDALWFRAGVGLSDDLYLNVCMYTVSMGWGGGFRREDDWNKTSILSKRFCALCKYSASVSMNELYDISPRSRTTPPGSTSRAVSEVFFNNSQLSMYRSRCYRYAQNFFTCHSMFGSNFRLTWWYFTFVEAGWFRGVGRTGTRGDADVFRDEKVNVT